MEQIGTERLREEVARFKAWSAAVFPGPRYGEWETEYPEWDALYKAAIFVLKQDKSWTAEEIDLLLYVIARDNEAELVASEVPHKRLLEIARSSLNSQEHDAKWQLEIRLPELGWNVEIENLLLSFSADDDEYVRRRAMLTLAKCQSTHTERLAEQAWATGHEYQRIAVLHALYRVKSPLLQNYLPLAIQDGRQYLVTNAENIRNGKSDD